MSRTPLDQILCSKFGKAKTSCPCPEWPSSKLCLTYAAAFGIRCMDGFRSCDTTSCAKPNVSVRGLWTLVVLRSDDILVLGESVLGTLSDVYSFLSSQNWRRKQGWFALRFICTFGGVRLE
ncbi:hypothetical protein PILCRDRAFT_639109 [Piloderma croceum F 1598]|uniref:Uncharacterized protein n=1 Tax=Piloderma croceum (strain F 1598) TaxID=765440 RepID=A0A0C3ARX1_PILCF|nr:hypothetical protein PILCRDRAFT_639109 [Piloderma croceum F 1598]